MNSPSHGPIHADEHAELRRSLERERLARAEAVASLNAMRHAALHDPLTLLPNRARLFEHLERCLRRHREGTGAGLAMLFLDVDNFKLVNDSLGHDAGDVLLLEIAGRLRTTLERFEPMIGTGMAMPARIGGDEFVVVFESVEHPELLERIAEHIQTSLQAPLQLREHEVTTTASIGIVICSDDRHDANTILREADMAMYCAKRAGKAGHALYDASMHVAARKRLELESQLRHALERGEFRLHYQPIIALTSGCIESFEALLRWRQADGTECMPDEFVPVLEDTHLIVPVGRWVLEEAARQLAAWRRQLPPDRRLSIDVNVSRRQLIDPSFAAYAGRTVEAAGLEPHHLNLEITESAVTASPDIVHRRLRELKALGVGLMMDNFGTGLSSLSYLQRYPFDVLKMDRSFIRQDHRRREYFSVLHAIVTLGHNLGMTVTVEGVSTPTQCSTAAALECDHVQGTLFSEPVNADRAWDLLAANTSWGSSELSRLGC